MISKVDKDGSGQVDFDEVRAAPARRRARRLGCGGHRALPLPLPLPLLRAPRGPSPPRPASFWR